MKLRVEKQSCLTKVIQCLKKEIWGSNKERPTQTGLTISRKMYSKVQLGTLKEVGTPQLLLPASS